MSAEAAGIVAKIGFDSGDLVPKGKLLVELDTKVERADLASAITARDLAALEAGRARELERAGAIAVAVRDEAEAQLRDAEARVASRKATIERRKIRAPFAGRVGIREVDLGQFLNPGDRITVLETSESVFVDFTLPQEQLQKLSVGMTVRVGLRDRAEQRLEGEVAAIVPSVDPATRNVTIRARVPNPKNQLRTGMFLDVSVVLPEKRTVVVVPATAIVHASYGDSVFVLEEKPADAPGTREVGGKPVRVARQHFVKLGATRGDFVAVTSGLEAGKAVVTAGAFKLRNGVPVIVTESGQPSPSFDPRLPNR
jgi:membrane fusion protein (multidrug efflux system)